MALPQSAARSNTLAEIVSAGTNIGGETTGLITYTTDGTQMSELANVVIGLSYTFHCEHNFY